MPPTDTQQLYAEDEILMKLESAMKQSSDELEYHIQAAIKERKKELRNK